MDWNLSRRGRQAPFLPLNFVVGKKTCGTETNTSNHHLRQRARRTSAPESIIIAQVGRADLSTKLEERRNIRHKSSFLRQFPDSRKTYQIPLYAAAVISFVEVQKLIVVRLLSSCGRFSRRNPQEAALQGNVSFLMRVVLEMPSKASSLSSSKNN